GIAALDHEVGNSAMKDHAIVERLVVHQAAGTRSVSVFGSGGEADEVSDRVRGLGRGGLALRVAGGGVERCAGIRRRWLGRRAGFGTGLCGSHGSQGQINKDEFGLHKLLINVLARRLFPRATPAHAARPATGAPWLPLS